MWQYTLKYIQKMVVAGKEKYDVPSKCTAHGYNISE
jgi:hypothetical protein